MSTYNTPWGTTSIKLTTKQARPIVSKAFPSYSGRRFRIEFTDKVSVHDTNWGGGTCNAYVVLNANGNTNRVTVPAPWLNLVEGKTYPLGPDVLVIVHSIFCGKDLGIIIYAHPSHLPKWLPA